jgi:hypothetical protein
MFAVMAGAMAGVANGQVTYYVQLIRGTDAAEPPLAGSKRVGACLAGVFRGPLKWNNYWEICQRKVEVAPGRSARVSLINAREVEIDLTKPGQRTVTAFQNGNSVDRTTVPASGAMTLIGGERDQKSIWFIVVRRDKPAQ